MFFFNFLCTFTPEKCIINYNTNGKHFRIYKNSYSIITLWGWYAPNLVMHRTEVVAATYISTTQLMHTCPLHRNPQLDFHFWKMVFSVCSCWVFWTQLQQQIIAAVRGWRAAQLLRRRIKWNKSNMSRCPITHKMPDGTKLDVGYYASGNVEEEYSLIVCCFFLVVGFKWEKIR